MLNSSLGLFKFRLSPPIILDLVGVQPSATFGIYANISTGRLANIVRIRNCVILFFAGFVLLKCVSLALAMGVLAKVVRLRVLLG